MNVEAVWTSAERFSDLRASTRAEDDAMMWGVTAVLALLALGSGVTSVVLFVKKKTIGGVLVLIAALVLGALAAALGALMLIASFAWH